MNPDRDSCAEKTEVSPKGQLHRCRSESVGVLQTAGEFRLVARRRIAAGERLFRLEGEPTDRPSRYSVQLEENLHLDLAGQHSEAEILERYFWRFINHDCEPNSRIEDRELITRREIEEGEAVTYNYNTTEWDIAERFFCRCGSPNCLGEIRGFKYLTTEQRAALRDFAPHLARAAQGELPIGEPQSA